MFIFVPYKNSIQYSVFPSLLYFVNFKKIPLPSAGKETTRFPDKSVKYRCYNFYRELYDFGSSRTKLSLKRTWPPALKHKVFARLFQKAAGWRGGVLPRPSQWAKSSRFPQAQEGRPNRPGDGLAVGNPSEGFPILHQLV